MNEKYILYLKETLKDNFDVKYRVFRCDKGIIYAVFIDDLCDSKFMSECIFEPLIEKINEVNDIEKIKEEVLWANLVGNVTDKDEALIHILSGDVILIFSFFEQVIYCESKGFSKRAISMPGTEAVIKGPREGFTEVIVDNVSLIRRRIKNPNLKFESMYMGEKSNTTVMMAYIKGTAPEELVNYLREKLKNMKIEFLLDTNYIEEQLKNNHSIFDTIAYTEKPDIASAKLFEGRVAIIVDGSPFVITAPTFFIENLQTADDYYLNKYFSNIQRAVRIIAFFIACFLPGLYIALTTYHFNLIPAVFVFKLATSRAGVPFPIVVEVMLMSFFFQLIREAGIRLSQPTGQAMSIVGALILGDAAVGAGLASQSTVVIVSIASISSFLIPKFYSPILIWQNIIVITSSMLGLPGFYIGFLILVSHMAGLESCGYPYLFPISTFKKYNSDDVFFRKDLSKISKTILKEVGKK